MNHWRGDAAVVDGRVCGGERIENAGRDVDRGLVVELLADRLHHRFKARERRSVDVLEHHHELAVAILRGAGRRRAILCARGRNGEEVEQADDRGMREARVRRSLTREHAGDLFVAPEGRHEDLQHDGPLEAVRPFGLGEEDVARPAGGETSHDAVGADALDRLVQRLLSGIGQALRA